MTAFVLPPCALPEQESGANVDSLRLIAKGMESFLVDILVPTDGHSAASVFSVP